MTEALNAVAIRMPKMSMTMTEGEVISWNVAVGDEVEAGDVVCEVMTDKVDMEVEAPVGGVLERIVVEAGVVPVGEPIGWIRSAETDSLAGLFDAPMEDELTAPLPVEPAPPADLPEVAAAAPVAAVAPAAPEVAAATTIAAVPAARRLAREHGVELASVVGTGPNGLVLPRDVEAVVASAAPVVATTTVPAGVPAGTSTPPQVVTAPVAASAPTIPAAPSRPAAQSRPAAPAPLATATDRRRAAVRARTAAKMVESAAVPQFTLWREIRLDAMAPVRGTVSWTAVMLRAYARALRSTQDLLGQWEGDHVVNAGVVAVGLAVDSPAGLVAPTFTDPDLLGLEELDRDIRATVAAARGGKADAARLAPATGMLSNLGGLGVDRFQALLTPPQASALSLGTIRERPVAIPGGVGLGLTVEAGLTVDHRVADGADGARLLDELVTLLADPALLLAPGSGG